MMEQVRQLQENQPQTLENVTMRISTTETEQRLNNLKEQLKQVRRKRALVAQRKRQYQSQQETLRERLSQLAFQRQSTMQEYQSVVTRRHSMRRYLDLAGRWNVINDCFHIWHAGPWATINGARLGGEAPRLPGGLMPPEHYIKYHSHVNSGKYSKHTTADNPNDPAANTTTTSIAPRRYMLWSSATNSNTSASSLNSADPLAGSTASVSTTSTPATVSSFSIGHTPHLPAEAPRVPWSEINTALGYVVLLLDTLQKRAGWLLPHDMIPLGSMSQMGVRRRTATASKQQQRPAAATPYPLYFDDASFSLFKGGNLRNFHVALTALLENVLVASRQLTDKTIVMPHAIQANVGSGSSSTGHKVGSLPQPSDWTIGGLTLVYNSEETNAAVEFTQASKYLLTNIKWLVAYAAKHHVVR